MKRLVILGIIILVVGSASFPVVAAPFKTPPQSIQLKVIDFPSTPSITLRSNPMIVSLKEAKQLVDEKSVLVLDARSTATHEYARLPGAKLATTGEPDTLKWLTTLSSSTPVLIYCGSKSCKMSSKLAKYMEQSGFKHIYLFEGGFSEWDAAGYPIDGSRKGTN